jgi:hypothetical protein
MRMVRGGCNWACASPVQSTVRIPNHDASATAKGCPLLHNRFELFNSSSALPFSVLSILDALYAPVMGAVHVGASAGKQVHGCAAEYMAAVHGPDDEMMTSARDVFITRTPSVDTPQYDWQGRRMEKQLRTDLWSSCLRSHQRVPTGSCIRRIYAGRLLWSARCTRSLRGHATRRI